MWRPIETAPKSDSAMTTIRVLLFMGGATTVGYWDDDKYARKPRSYWRSERGHLFGARWDRDNQPTHWMPLPTPPDAKVVP